MSASSLAPWTVRRLPGNPIVGPHAHPRIGANVQGPSAIRVPDWVESPLGRYYLYFADHKGDHIRLAFADRPQGPWHIHAPGALSLQDSLFPTVRLEAGPDDAPPPPRSDWAPAGTAGIPTQFEDATIPHIASPDVHVDHANRRIVMYYHGLAAFGRQRTRVAVSRDGLRFEPRAPLLGPSYFRVFAYRGNTYALVMPGRIHRSANGFDDFEPGPDLFGDPRQRHSAVLLRGDVLWVVWSRVGEAPERLYVSRVDVSGDWLGWRAAPPQELMRPETEWEGAMLPVEPSWRSAVATPTNQLRDPAILEDEGRLWLYYAVRGENGIAVAELLEAG